MELNKTTKVNFYEKYPHLKMPLSKMDLLEVMKNDSFDKSRISLCTKLASYEELREYYDYSEKPQLENVSVCSIIGGRRTMEDYYAVENFGDVKFYGVFDGHGGWEIASLVSNEMPKRFSKLKIDYSDANAVTEAIHNVCLELGKEIYELNDLLRTGSTAVFVLHYKQYLYVANIGDSTAVVFDQENKIHLKTVGHKPINEEEEKRIKSTGSNVFFGRVDENLAVSRSFGDNYYNYESDDYPNKQTEYDGFNTTISIKPDIYTLVIPENQKMYLVLGSDGLWDFCDFESKEESEMKFTTLADIVKNDELSVSSKKIVELGKKPCMSSDNVTAIIVHL